MTPEEVAKEQQEDAEHQAEEERRWPLSQRRPRCLNCGAFTPKKSNRYTRCKVCDESYDSLQ